MSRDTWRNIKYDQLVRGIKRNDTVARSNSHSGVVNPLQLTYCTRSSPQLLGSVLPPHRSPFEWLNPDNVLYVSLPLALSQCTMGNPQGTDVKSGPSRHVAASQTGIVSSGARRWTLLWHLGKWMKERCRQAPYFTSGVIINWAMWATALQCLITLSTTLVHTCQRCELSD